MGIWNITILLVEHTSSTIKNQETGSGYGFSLHYLECSLEIIMLSLSSTIWRGKEQRTEYFVLFFRHLFPTCSVPFNFYVSTFQLFFFVSNVLTSKVLLIIFYFELLFPRLCPYPAWPYISEIDAMCDPRRWLLSSFSWFNKSRWIIVIRVSPWLFRTP
jgi:hypothetical protein